MHGAAAVAPRKLPESRPRRMSSIPTVTKQHFYLLLYFFVGDPLQRESAVKLACGAISARIFDDLGSESNVNLCVITTGGTDMLRNYVKDNEEVTKERNSKFRHATTEVKRDREVVRSLAVSETVRPIVVGGGDAMDTS